LRLAAEKVALEWCMQDNCGAKLLGGICADRDYHPLGLIQASLCRMSCYCTLLHPHFGMNTAWFRRSVLRRSSSNESIHQSIGKCRWILAGLYSGRLWMISRSLKDVIGWGLIDCLIPGFYECRETLKRCRRHSGMGIQDQDPTLLHFQKSWKLRQNCFAQHKEIYQNDRFWK